MADSRLLDALRALLPAVFPREPFAYPRRYRVLQMRPSASSAEPTRAELQIVQKATGLPNLLIVPIAPGLAGSRSEITPGAIVLVQFIDGDRSLPIITHFATADDPAWKPVTTIIDATTIKLGSAATLGVVRLHDAVHGGFLMGTAGPYPVLFNYLPASTTPNPPGFTPLDSGRTTECSSKAVCE